MKSILLLLCVIAASDAAFFPILPSSGSEAMHVCVFSNDPVKYTPKCFICPVPVYPFSLQACVNSTTMPSNITYDSATCIEKNCEINYPTARPAPADGNGSSNRTPDFIELLGKILMGKNIYKRSIEDNELEKDKVEKLYEELISRMGQSSPNTDWKIVGEVETFASSDAESEIEFQFDYAT